jgi:hypothetical protein
LMEKNSKSQKAISKMRNGMFLSFSSLITIFLMAPAISVRHYTNLPGTEQGSGGWESQYFLAITAECVNSYMSQTDTSAHPGDNSSFVLAVDISTAPKVLPKRSASKNPAISACYPFWIVSFGATCTRSSVCRR